MHDTITRAISALAESQIAQATGLSMVLGVIRVMYDEHEHTWSRIWLEGAMCGLLTLIVGMAVQQIGLSMAWAFVFGGSLAFVGVTMFRKTMLMIVKSRWVNRGDAE